MPERNATPRQDARPSTAAERVKPKQPVSKSSSAHRPRETILVGAFNAVKKPPEWLGKKTVDLYDKFRFPKLTPEEKKMKDKLHAMLKKHYKAVGWVEMGVAATAVSVIVARGFQKIRFRKQRETTMIAKNREFFDAYSLMKQRMQKALCDRYESIRLPVPLMYADYLTAFVMNKPIGAVLDEVIRARQARSHIEQNEHLRNACMNFLQTTANFKESAIKRGRIGALFWERIEFLGAEKLGVTLLPNVENA